MGVCSTPGRKVLDRVRGIVCMVMLLIRHIIMSCHNNNVERRWPLICTVYVVLKNVFAHVILRKVNSSGDIFMFVCGRHCW